MEQVRGYARLQKICSDSVRTPYILQYYQDYLIASCTGQHPLKDCSFQVPYGEDSLTISIHRHSSTQLCFSF